jgi:preprotein translocase subunit SecF
MEDSEEIKEEIKEETKQETPQAEEKTEAKQPEIAGKKEEHQKHAEKKREEKPMARKDWSQIYDKNYKKLLLISLVVFAAALIYIGVFYAQNGDIMRKDVSLTGGTTITVYTDKANVNEIEASLKGKLGNDITIRKLEDITTRKTIAFTVSTTADANTTKTALEEYLNYSLNNSNSGTEISGSALAHSFYRQLLIAMAIAFIFMAIVVLIIFRAAVPSLMVVLCAAADIICALALVDMLGFKVSTAGIAAFLMLIGYSVDTDTMLTTKVLKRRGEGTLNSRIGSAFKTGMIMTLTSLVAVLFAYFIAQASVLKEIFLILGCGLVMDIFFTWLLNASLLKLYCERKKIN